jgi:hypothetical protein
MKINSAKLFIHYNTYTEYTYVNPTDYDFPVIYEMTNKNVTGYYM